ncbi:MAG: hypothetical protein ACW99Q_01070 [Candidatus Kariarchaeaceae archaeon]|jgi:hypothetical protein
MISTKSLDDLHLAHEFLHSEYKIENVDNPHLSRHLEPKTASHSGVGDWIERWEYRLKVAGPISSSIKRIVSFNDIVIVSCEDLYHKYSDTKVPWIGIYQFLEGKIISGEVVQDSMALAMGLGLQSLLDNKDEEVQQYLAQLKEIGILG